MAVFDHVSMFCQVFFPSLPIGLFSALGKEFDIPSAIILPSVVSAALGKQLFCRVPDEMHSVNILPLDKSPVSVVVQGWKEKTSYVAQAITGNYGYP